MKTPLKKSEKIVVGIQVAVIVLLVVCIVYLVGVLRDAQQQPAQSSPVSPVVYHAAMVDDPVIGPALRDPLPEAQSLHGEITQSIGVTVVGWRDGSRQASLEYPICILSVGARVSEVAVLDDGARVLEYTGGPSNRPVQSDVDCQPGALSIYAPNDDAVKFFQLT